MAKLVTPCDLGRYPESTLLVATSLLPANQNELACTADVTVYAVLPLTRVVFKTSKNVHSIESYTSYPSQ